MKNNIIPIVFLSLFISKALFAQEKQTLVSNQSELNSAISAAKPGDKIIMKDGVWHDININFNAKAGPTSTITIKAQTPGNVILNGSSTLTFSSPNLVVDGLFFKQGALSEQNSSVVNFESDHCRLTNVAIIDYNPQSFETKYFWVYFKGSYNRMDHCLMKGKNNMNPIVQNDEENARYNRVDSCYVKDIPFIDNANGREIFRIFGYGHADQLGDDGAYFTIEYNLFDHAHGEGTEIVSLKSNHNIVRFNTVIASRGGLVGRRGKFNTFEGNFVLGQGQQGSTGIRVAGANHRVFNNYVADVEEDGLRLITGEYFEKSLTSNFAPKKKALPKYLQVQNGYFANNTIVNCGGNGIDIGFSYKNHWPDLQMVLMPENNQFINNLVYNCKGNALNIAQVDKNVPLNIFTFKPNNFEGNIIFGNKTSNTAIPEGVKIQQPKLSLAKDGLFRLDKDSPLINAGLKADLKTDMDGQIRDAKMDIGADEFSASKLTIHPLSAQEVGPIWIISKEKSGEKF